MACGCLVNGEGGDGGSTVCTWLSATISKSGASPQSATEIVPAPASGKVWRIRGWKISLEGGYVENGAYTLYFFDTPTLENQHTVIAPKDGLLRDDVMDVCFTGPEGAPIYEGLQGLGARCLGTLFYEEVDAP
jgi:hypothetical protein